ncbi:MAG: 50S ribosomal protein L24 [Candidatus Magasanikbacteria bacterium RIFCSPHIGHO2_01_FULL_47_8]|uniref:Large ribosomal subunit protein uL24 n=1 Tax=Candidatus Magasanikbacteria bacterium RIFCSPHIGHO2_01_FULL_47_8 TaxID=1798673 RepID=A0A1F6MCT8_9BACT|nr:MAG: 50S ribosomal protein L24 [Candidatus Magasanikbacteria bacterium RIFCSPHIGHO2_01_FULL_47_8]
MKIKVNDKVKVLSGKDKGKTGKVIQVFAEEGKIVVEGVNKIKKHLRAKGQTDKGQVVELSSPMPMGKTMLLCPKCEKPIRVGYKTEAGKKNRYCRECGQIID